MATENRNGARRSSNGAKSNRPRRRDQDSRTLGAARDNPLATAAVVGGALAAGAFLWSRRNQISDQIGNLAEQISDWRENAQVEDDLATGGLRDTSAVTHDSGLPRSGRTQAEIAQEALTLKELGTAA